MFKKAIAALAVGLVGLMGVAACSSQNPSAASASTSTPGAANTRAQAQVAPDGSIGMAQQTGIWVSGEGKVSAQPDLALLSLGVESRARTVEEARAAAATSMTAVLDAIKKHGVVEKDIQTRYFNISPEYTYRTINDQFGQRSQQVLVGYVVTNQATVKVRKLDDVGPVIHDVSKAGGDLTRLQGVGFTIDDPTTLQTQARDLAVKAALAKADQMAKAAGVTLGRAFYIADMSINVQPPMPYAARGLAAPAEAGTPISTGELNVTVSVQTAFSIR
ncbi:MAG: DUF541 domain-containing protein [Dehalococcoidia bacterium]|nr:DUF541 domain-containing protein [Dehalococcoidia bacterium]